MDVNVREGFVDKPDEILSCGDAADRTGKNVVKHQGGNAELCQRAAHGGFYNAVHAAAHEHAATLDVNGAHRVGKQHDAEDEPRRGFADVAFRFAAGVIGGRSQVVEHDGSGTPKGNKG